MKTFSFLALGDSYTIGEQLDLKDNFPNQTVAILNQEEKQQYESPKIIAKTGWTTDELLSGIAAENMVGNTYDFVSLLIGVNNQYRNLSKESYAIEFEELLDLSIRYAGNKHNRVVVFSIPDWGVTPFAKEKNVNENDTAAAIDAFNAINKSISIRKNVHYIDITFSTRFHGVSEDYLAADGLHYAAMEYKIWAEQLASIMKQQLKDEQ